MVHVRTSEVLLRRRLLASMIEVLACCVVRSDEVTCGAANFQNCRKTNLYEFLCSSCVGIYVLYAVYEILIVGASKFRAIF